SRNWRRCALNEGFSIPADILDAFQADRTTWRNFRRFPTSYQRIRVAFCRGRPESAGNVSTTASVSGENDHRKQTVRDGSLSRVVSWKHRRGECAYCRKDRKLTDDHVPPRRWPSTPSGPFDRAVVLRVRWRIPERR